MQWESKFVLVYASNFKDLICNINWDKQILMSQFHLGLWDDIKDLLFYCKLQILGGTINEVVKCDIWWF